MDIPELVLRVKEQMERLVTAEQKGWEDGVKAELVKLRAILTIGLPVEAPAEPDSPDQAGRT